MKRGDHLDSSSSIQTQRRYMSKMPANIEELRTEHKVMANIFLLANMRQPSRNLYKKFGCKYVLRLTGRIFKRPEFSHGV